MVRKKDLLEKINQLKFDLKWLQKQIQHSNDNRKGLATIKQLQCAAKGHDFVFEKKEEYNFWASLRPKPIKYQFKCTNCDLTITKTIDELTSIEKEALKDLGILEEENGKTR